MQHVGNEVLAEWIKLFKLSGRPFLEHDLGPSDAVEVSPLRTLNGVTYYQYADGTSERLVLTDLPSSEVYAALLRPQVRVLAVGATGIRITAHVGPHARVTSVVLLIGDSPDEVRPDDIRDDSLSFTIPASIALPDVAAPLRVRLAVLVGGEALTVEVPLPRAPVERLLARAGLATLEVSGRTIVFTDDPSDEARRRVLAAVEHGRRARPLVEPLGLVAGGDLLGPVDVASASAVVDHSGCRYLILGKTPEDMATLDLAAARTMARGLRWPDRPRGGSALRSLRRGAIRGGLRVLGYERYEKLRGALPALRQPDAYRRYVQRFEQSAAIPRTVVHVGFNYSEFSGHLAALAQEFQQVAPHWRQIVVVSDVDEARRTCARLGVAAEVLHSASPAYGEALARAEIIVTDSTLPRWFIPRPDQRLFNVWHGTPLKAMGRSIGGAPRAMANTQRNFLSSAGVLLSNQHTIDSFVTEYMIPGTNVELWPSPRNTWLFDRGRRAGLRAQLGVSDDEFLVLYLPTWRGEGNQMRDVEQNVRLFESFSRVVTDVQRPARFYAKPHRFTEGRVDPEVLGLAVPPPDLDLYEFLHAVDCLVTDYSSVLFDFLLLDRPIVLDSSDLDEYRGSRGLCLDPSELGLPMAPDPASLAAAIDAAPAHVDHSALRARFAPLDGPEGARAVVGRMLRPTPRPVPEAAKPRVLLYPGSLWTNGITTSFLNLLGNLDQSAREYWILLPESFTSRPGPGALEAILASGIRFLPTPAGFIVRRQERATYKRFLARLELSTHELALLDSMMEREARRTLPDLHFDHAVNFSGYEAFIAKFLDAMTTTGTKLHTWVHNDMRREQETRRNFNEQIILESYRRSTTINVVSEPVAERLLQGFFPPDVHDRVRVVHNTAGSDKVLELARAEVDYMTPELAALLADPGVTRFVSIGRFSAEKDHTRLVEAFDEVSRANPGRRTALFLIGGPGNAQGALMARISASPFADRIRVFESINPHPILSHCDLFVLSSHYEGLPMVFFEALALEVPILSTAIPGPQQFLERGYGATCPPSTQGLVQGMQDFLDGRLPRATRSLADFNNQAVAEFEAIFEA